MDPRLLEFYSRELQHVRDMAAEFAAQFPKVASRLAIDNTEVEDPYVERLLEGFAFLTARVQLKLDEQFPKFTRHLLESLYPNYLAPLPSVGIARLEPRLSDPNLLRGVKVERDQIFQSHVIQGVSTACKFRVCHAIKLWPLRLSRVAHSSAVSDLPVRRTNQVQVRSLLSLTLNATAGSRFSQIDADSLDFFISAADEHAFALFDRWAYDTQQVYVRPSGVANWKIAGQVCVAPTGFESDQSLLPENHLGFEAYRHIQEFFTSPHRFLFVRVSGLKAILAQHDTNALELAFGFEDIHEQLDRQVDLDSISLNCTPVVNLFSHRCDRILLDTAQHEFMVQPDRAHPQDFEIFAVEKVGAYGQSARKLLDVPPLYHHHHNQWEDLAYCIRREVALPSEKRTKEGGRSRYIGTDVYLTFTETALQLEQARNIRQFGVQALCTNRDLPLLMPVDQTNTDLFATSQLPLESIRMLRGPTRPRAPQLTGKAAWQLVELLTMNYLSLMGGSGQAGTQVLTRLLSLFADPADSSHRLISHAISEVTCSRVAKPLRSGGRMALAQGLRLDVALDEYEMQGIGLGVLGGVLARFFARHVSVNSMVDTHVQGVRSGKKIQWNDEPGVRFLL